MKNIMESVTYMSTAIATLTLIRTLKNYWHNIPIFLYFVIILICALLTVVYLRSISQRDREWVIKALLIYSVLIIVAAIFFSFPLEIIFSVSVSGVVGLSTYHNYYRMADYMLQKAEGKYKSAITYSPDNFYLSSGSEINLDELLMNSDRNLFELLKEIKNGMDCGEITLYYHNGVTHLRRWDCDC